MSPQFFHTAYVSGSLGAVSGSYLLSNRDPVAAAVGLVGAAVAYPLARRYFVQSEFLQSTSDRKNHRR